MLFALKKITLKTLKILLPSIVLGIFWGLKNLLISGCLLFPVELSCFNSISWYQKGSANFEMQELKNLKNLEKLENINEVDQEGNEQDPQQDPQQERENPEGNVVEELDVIK